MENTKTLAQARNELKALGFTLRTKRYSDFIAGKVFDAQGNQLNAGIATKRDKAFTAWRAENKGKIFDGMFRVII